MVFTPPGISLTSAMKLKRCRLVKPLSPFPSALADSSSSQNGFLGFPFELSDENVVAACTVVNMGEAGEGMDEAAPLKQDSKLSVLSEDGASWSIKDLFRISP